MNYTTKINPVTCPRACAEIVKRFNERKPGIHTVVFKGLGYVVNEQGEVWGVSVTARRKTFENQWTDEDFFPTASVGAVDELATDTALAI